jgi:hypothetical protein
MLIIIAGSNKVCLDIGDMSEADLKVQDPKQKIVRYFIDFVSHLLRYQAVY